MIRRRLLGFIGLELTCFGVSATQPAPSTFPEVDTLQSASVKALAWFQTLGSSLSSIVATEKRSQLIDMLMALHQHLYAVEQDKVALLVLLKQGDLPRQDLLERTLLLRSEISQVQLDLRGIGPLLRLKYRDEGVEVESLLTDAAMTKKEWVFQLDSAPKSKREALIKQGDAAVSAVRAADVELAKFIAKLQSIDGANPQSTAASG